MVEKIISTIEPIHEMGQATSEGFDRLANETFAALAEGPQTDLVVMEQQRLAVEQQLGRTFNRMIEGCANDCWLRGIIKLRDRKVGGGPSLRLLCLPNAPMAHRPLAEQEELCTAAHGAARSEFDHFVAPGDDPSNYET